MIENITNTEELLTFHEQCAARGRELMKRKNHDYSGVEDVFRNFRMFGALGIVVRAGDKLSRLKSFEEKGTMQVADESIMDTAIDLMNYAILYLGYKRDRRDAPRKVGDVLNDETAFTYLKARHSFTCAMWQSLRLQDCDCGAK